MKKILYYIAIACVMVGMTACVDLDTTPYGQATEGNMWSTESLVDMGVTGVYSCLKKPMYSYSLVGSDLRLGYYGLDVLGMSGSSRLSMQGLFTQSVTPGNSYFSDMWKWCYNGIQVANEAIANIPHAQMSEEKKAKRLAEVKTLRAFFYGRANEIFGSGGLGVPLYLEPVAADEVTYSQTPEAKVWEHVISDLTDAIKEPNLPDNDIRGEGRVSKGAAYALRGRAYLITKQYDLAIDDFSKVKDAGYKLFTGAGNESYKMLFKAVNEQCEEMILSIQYIEDPTKSYGSTLQKYVAAFQQGARDSRGCWTDIRVAPAVVELYEVINSDGTVKPFDWAEFIPEWNNVQTNDRKVFFIRNKQFNGAEIHPSITGIIDGSIGLGSVSASAKSLYLPGGNEERIKKAYANRDPRLAFNVVTPYAEFVGVNSSSTAEGTYVYRWPVPGKPFFDQAEAESNYAAGYKPSGCANASSELVYIHRKFVGEGLEFAYRESNPIDEPIIRYADVLLQWAEALVEQEKLDDAKEIVKQIRNRVGIATPDAPFANKDLARDYVRDERRREFVGEGINFFDEMRWRTLKQTKFNRKFVEQVYGGQVSSGGTYEWIGDQWYTWPVPTQEAERNPNLKPTPGWVYN